MKIYVYTRWVLKHLFHLSYEIHDYQVKNYVRENEISETPFWTDAFEIFFILRVNL